MGNSSSVAARSAYALRFVLVVLVCLVYGLVFGYSTAPALKWLGKQIAVAEISQLVPLDSYASRRTESDLPAKVVLVSNAVPRQASVDWLLTVSPKAVSATSDEGHLPTSTLRAGPNVQDSRLGRPVQTDDLRSLSSVRNGSHLGEHREIKAHWGYCGNPQCTLCYPVADSKVASDFPDMPQGYCKRHPQSRDCKPIVVPAPKPLPKATHPSQRLTRDRTEAGKRDHRRIFTELARALDLQHIVLKPPQLPSLAEFRTGCERYQREQYFSRAVCHSMAAK